MGDLELADKFDYDQYYSRIKDRAFDKKFELSDIEDLFTEYGDFVLPMDAISAIRTCDEAQITIESTIGEITIKMGDPIGEIADVAIVSLGSIVEKVCSPLSVASVVSYMIGMGLGVKRAAAVTFDGNETGKGWTYLRPQ